VGATVPDLVLLGNLLVDDIVLRDGRTLMGEPGGAMLYAALAANAWGLNVGLVTVLGSDYPTAALDALRARGVDLGGVRALGRPGVRTWLLYEERARRVVHHLGRPSHREVSPTFADIPKAWLGARAFHLSPMPIECQRELASGLAHNATNGASYPNVSLDPHEPVSTDNLDTWREVLANVDAFFPSEDELRIDLSPLDLARTLSGQGRLRFVASKRAEKGGVLVDLANSSHRSWAASSSKVVDPTGAGDAFAGGFLAGWLGDANVDRALSQGSISAAQAVSEWGTRGLRQGGPANV
jgi:sugar/nucleoside kinase (ribokinase family)